MKFIKLHQNGKELLVNMNNVTEVYPFGNNNSGLHFNFEVDREQECITVDESLDEILEMVEQASECKSLTDEIKLTIELMQGDIDDGAHSELQSHLYSLLEMKRERLGERAQPDLAVPVPAIVWLSGMGGSVKTGSKL